MGSQVAALLAGPPPYGDPPPELPVTGRTTWFAPPGFGLAATVRSGQAVGLPPLSFDGTRLTRLVPGGAVSVTEAPGTGGTSTHGPSTNGPSTQGPSTQGLGPREPAAQGPADRGRLGLEVTVHSTADPTETAGLRTVLGLDDDLAGLHEGCAQVPSLAWVPAVGAGRVLRSPTVFEDLVQLLLGTGTSFARVRAVLRRLPPVEPEGLARLGEEALREAGAGFRAAPLAHLSRVVADGTVDPEAWRRLHDDEVVARVLVLPGLGPFSAASLLPLLGRPRPLVLDRWLGLQARALGLHDRADVTRRYAPLGRWAGTGLWLEVSSRWLRP